MQSWSSTRGRILRGESDSVIIDCAEQKGRIRKRGGGRKKVTEHQPDLLNTIENIVSPHLMGDPMNPLRWTRKSIRKITAELLSRDYTVSHEVVRRCLIERGYSLQINKKTKEGGNSPDRDAQFEHINNTAKEFVVSNDPVISVDCKKKELIGEYKNNGQEWTPVKKTYRS